VDDEDDIELEQTFVIECDDDADLYQKLLEALEEMEDDLFNRRHPN
jgi:hypothetical protein